MRTIRLVIEYDGTAYCGWQRQRNGLSVQEVLEEAVARITGEASRVVGSGRTDAGVHALGQVAHFQTSSRLAERNLLMGINSLLPCDIVVRDLREAAEGFHARFDATSKVYLYRICNRPVRPALQRQRAWFVWESLDMGKIKEVIPVLVGRHDFSSFCSTHTDAVDRIRTVLSLTALREAPDMINILIEADGFLRYMVRTIVGTLVEVGRGRLTGQGLEAILKARDRSLAPVTAPPHGLYLLEVKYEKEAAP